MSGAFVPREIPVATPDGGLGISIDENRKPANSLVHHVHFDACPIWLQLAIRHLSDAQVAQVSRVAAWKGGRRREGSGVGVGV